MRKIVRDQLPLFQFHLFQKFSEELDHAVTTRAGGFSTGPYGSFNLRFGIGDELTKVKRNRALLCKALKISPKQLISANQTHSKRLAVIDHPLASSDLSRDSFDDIDGFITNIPGIALLVQVADCQALLMFDPVKKIIAALHAGWRGLVQDISGEAIAILRQRFGVRPANLIVGISPSLGPCCSFFTDPKRELPPDFQPFIRRLRGQTSSLVDLWGYSVRQLRAHGVLARNIELARVCTMCGGNGEQGQGTENFFSFRRDRGISGRFGAAILLR